MNKVRLGNFARAGAVVLLSGTLAACATTLGRNFDEKFAQQIKSGETKKADVLNALGNPPLRRTTGSEETWTYAYYTGPGFINWFNVSDEQLQYGLGNQKRLVVVFSGDVVKSAKYTQEIPQQ